MYQAQYIADAQQLKSRISRDTKSVDNFLSWHTPVKTVSNLQKEKEWHSILGFLADLFLMKLSKYLVTSFISLPDHRVNARFFSLPASLSRMYKKDKDANY